ncbi:MAG TPA: PEGA domain-containing protein [Tepidisphaeraceae bacterium]|jgi:hypothetical protein|nr:PEGA domain-containing protein [Tepidisphaeraceae bacterium]
MVKSFFWRGAVSMMLIGAIGGCSAFQPPTQMVSISTTLPGSDIYVDGAMVGKSPVTVSMQRNISHSILAKNGDRSGVATVDKRISGTGILDIVGTFVFLIPAIGLFTPGMWELDPTAVAVNMK